MNFLAHLHLAHLADSSLLGQPAGRFRARQPRRRLPAPEVVDGIMMHRRIDVLTDNLPEVTEASRDCFRAP